MDMYHFIGIKGTGMSSLALVMHSLGYEVQGSDRETHFFTEDALREAGIPILPFDENNIREDLFIIQGNAFHEDHVEVKRAMELGCKIYHYEEMVGKLTRMFETITISGCHGKTTTTSMLAHVLTELAGCNYLIGDGHGYAAKENKYFALEACEYQRHFLAYTPTYAVITNIDLDHTDYYKDIDDVRDAYREYASKAEKMVIACGDDPYTHSLDVTKPIFFYGLDDDNDILAKDVVYNESGIHFDVEVEGNYYGHFDLPFYGKHMLLNSLAVIAICAYERFEAREVAKALKTFKGAKRRFNEEVIDDVVLVDDYAHHPTEVRSTIKAARQKYPDKEIVAVLQPHTLARVRDFGEEFAESLNQADVAYVLPVTLDRGDRYEDYPNIDENIILNKLTNGHLIHMNEPELLLKHKNAVILFMSPRNIYDLKNALKELLEQNINK